ncbi:MAG TPA: hypothetical protein ENH82_12160 [bacterium]|nr:hypothetical protein [bacterium]
MIKQLTLHNFQSHKKSTLEFSDGVNVIIGASDSGKTAIIRALKWLVWNRPGGDAFRSTWGGETDISIEVDNLIIRRIKGKDKNLYQKDDTRYAAFGVDIPEGIKQFLNINEINLQNQLDAPFLLNSSPGDVAKHFNKIAHLDQIDSGLRKVQQWIREIEQDIQAGEQQVKQSEEQLLQFEHLEKFEANVEVLEDMQSRFLQKVSGSQVLKTLITAIKTTQDSINAHSEILELEPLLNKILDWCAEKKHAKESSEQLGLLIEELNQVEKDIDDHTHIVTAEKSVNSLLVMFSKQAELNSLRDSIGKLITNITNTEERLQTEDKGLKTLEKEFAEGFVDGICPLCNQPIRKK